MTKDRALEIIAAYGADVGRWPVDEALAVLALAARDAEVAAAIAGARQLDGLLGGWAAPVPQRRFDAAALLAAVPAPAGSAALAAPVLAPPVRRGWLAGGALAAAVAAALLLMPGARQLLPAAADGALPAVADRAVAIAPVQPQIAAVDTPAAAKPVESVLADDRRTPGTLASAVPGSDAEIFATLFTPTLDEDELI